MKGQDDCDEGKAGAQGLTNEGEGWGRLAVAMESKQDIGS
jgi:hypothetical protein